MPEKYHNKYRISSARLQNWDYGSNASYFVTIRIQNSKHIFGVIENGEMLLNDIGRKAETCIGVTKFAKTIYPEFEWQPRFHDHVIRDIKSFERIQKYIINNPRNWNGQHSAKHT